MPQQKLFEHLQRDPVFVQWNRVGRYIAERQLTDQEITTLFGNIQQNMTAAGQNRTMIGKGVDVAKGAAQSVGSAWGSLKDKIYNSGPMAGFATSYDRATESLKQATGGDKGLFQYVQKYRDFAEKHPIMQKAVYAALVAAAGMVGAAGGPAGIGAAVGLMQTFDKALQGQDIRSAIWSGTKAGVVAAGTATLADYLRGGKEAAAAATPTPVAPTGQETVIVQSGDTLSQIAKNSGVSVQDLMAANPQITNPDVIKAGQEITLPAITGNPVYQGGVGTAADTAAKIQSGVYQTAQDAAQSAAATPAPSPVDAAAASKSATSTTVRALNQTEQISLARELAQKMGIEGKLNFTAQGSIPTVINGQPVPTELLTPDQQRLVQAAQEMKRWMSGDAMAANPDRNFEESVKLAEAFNRVAAVIPLITVDRKQMINRDATVMQWSLNESLGNKTRSVQLTDRGISAMFENLAVWRAMILESDAPSAQRLRHNWNQTVNEAPLTAFGTVGAARAARLAQAAAAQKPGFFSRTWSGVKGAAQKVGTAAKNVGSELTTKVTANRLQSNWNKVKEYDSERLADWLTKAPQNVPKEVVADVFGKMNIPVPATMQAAPADAATAAPADAAAPVDAATAASSSAAPTEKKVAREIDAEIDDLIRALRKVDSIAAPAYVKYIRDRLDQTFGPATAAAPAPKKTISRKSKTAPQPKMQVVKGSTAPAPETMSIGGQKLNPKDPKDAELIARARAASAVAEDLVWSKHWNPTQRLLKGLAHDQ